MSQNFELLRQLESELPFRTASRVIPQAEETVQEHRPVSVSQELLSLAQTVFLSGNGKAPHEVVLCGVDKESGSSEICIQLGRVLAGLSSRPVCLVDADVHCSRLTGLFSASRHHPITFPDYERAVQVEENLWLASTRILDPTQSAALAPATLLKQSITELRKSFEYILIDAPGANAGSDAAVLGEIADAAILVLEANVTRKIAALKAKKTMETMNVRLIGVVLNNRTFPIPGAIYSRL